MTPAVPPRLAFKLAVDRDRRERALAMSNEGLTAAEVANQLGTTRIAAAKLIQRARKESRR